MAERARVAVLLGAGASADAGVPVSLQLTDDIINETRTTEHQRLLRYIRHRLEADAVLPKHGSFFFSGVDVERLFAAVEVLIERHTQPWSPFVASWDSDLESFGVPGAFGTSRVGEELARLLDERYLQHNTLYGPSRVTDAIQAVAREAIRLSQPDVAKLLVQIRSGMWDTLRGLLNLPVSKAVWYLRPLVEFAKTQRPLSVATLNYDLSVEMAAQTAGIVCDSRMGSQSKPLTESDVKLLKLHGSIDWVWEERQASGGLPMLAVRKEDTPSWGREPGIIFGEGAKLRADGPFLELLLEWASDLNDVNNLLVVGYSFRDPHVNVTIANWFNAEPTRAIVFLSKDSLDDLAASNEFIQALVRLGPASPRFRFFQGRARAELPAALADAISPPKD